ncbi:4-nitrophenylphosphatase [Malassezia caprae]|uniref:4-nitrophenylphosphatase n=1 Tax=Malassezia caprae TaxID=1381934 RepID=A0AAF0EDR0_9BASI|nr:4-nitrophenylphosphatase [Malassezia caprae]
MTSTSVPRGAYQHLQSKDEMAMLLDRYDNFLFDCDGVLWSGTETLPGVVSVLEKLRARGKRILFVTNNASKSRRLLIERIKQAGIHAELEEVFSSAYASALYLKHVLQLPPDRKVYVVGMAGLEEELDAVGIQHLGGTNPSDCAALQDLDFSPLYADGAIDPAVGAVLCGIDTALSYPKLAKAYRYITRPGATGEVKAGDVGGGCHFVCTNEDVTFPTKEGLFPGAGSVWSGLRDSSRRDPIVVGKPNQPMIDTIFASSDFEKARTIMVGDRLNTDILFGQRGGIDTMLVLTGVTQLEDVAAPDAPAVPTYVLAGLGSLDSVA